VARPQHGHSRQKQKRVLWSILSATQFKLPKDKTRSSYLCMCIAACYLHIQKEKTRGDERNEASYRQHRRSSKHNTSKEQHVDTQ
jgi:hypothetical protein